MIILLLLHSSLEALSGKGALKGGHQDVSKRFEIVAMSLLDTHVDVDGLGGVVGNSSEILVLSVRDMKMGLGSWNYLARPQSFSNVHEEVVWFDIMMIEISLKWVYSIGKICGS